MKNILIFLFSIITLSAFGQAGSLSQSVYRSRVNDSTAAIAANVAPIAAGYAPMFFNNQATTPHWDIWNGTAYDHVFDFNSGTGGGGWVTTGVQTLTGPFGVESADSIGIASTDVINLRSSAEGSSGFSKGDYTLGNLGDFTFNGIYQDASTGNWAYWQTAGGGSVNTVTLQNYPTGESHFTVLVDTMDLQLRKALEINDDPGTAGYVLQSNGAGAAPTWVAPTGGGGGLEALATIRTETATHDLDATDLTSINNDERLVIHMNSASPLTLEIPLNSSVAFPVGTIIEWYQEGAGQITFDPLSTVVMRSPANADKSYTQYSSGFLRKVATDTWVLGGDITP